MRAAGVDPAAVDTGAIAFRLAPRINAAGRLGHPVRARPAPHGGRPRGEGARGRARGPEPRPAGRRGADPARRDAPGRGVAGAQQRRLGYVIAGEDWHRGVIGIVASRLVERFRRPVVLIAGGEQGEEWTGSAARSRASTCTARSQRAHRTSRAGAATARRRGSPSARVGLRGGVRRCAARGAGRGGRTRPVTPVDAVVQGRELTLGLCEELERLEPFGLGNRT